MYNLSPYDEEGRSGMADKEAYQFWVQLLQITPLWLFDHSPPMPPQDYIMTTSFFASATFKIHAKLIHWR